MDRRKFLEKSGALLAGTSGVLGLPLLTSCNTENQRSRGPLSGRQWGMVIDGKMSLTIGDETKIYEKGDWYYIPEGVVHSAKFLTHVYVIDVFADSARYTAKDKQE